MLLSLAGFAFFSPKVHAATINPPIIEEVKKGVENTLAKPVITGTTDTGTEALIYIDGTYAGSGMLTAHYGSQNKFFFQQPVALSQGIHDVMAVARNNITRELSIPSATVQFIVPAYQPASPAPVPVPFAAPKAPTLVSPDANTVTSSQKETITGLVQSGARVLIYIDEIYNGSTKVIYHSSGTGAFYYKPFLKLDRGEHVVWAVAEDNYGQKSQASNTLNFKVEYPMPAPTMIRPVVNKYTTPAKPFIAGVAKNNSLVSVYIDKKLDGQFQVVNQSSGTANFAYTPSVSLTKNTTHRIYAKATDYRGKESKQSNLIYYTYPKQAVKKEAAAAKKVSGTSKITSTEKTTQSGGSATSTDNSATSTAQTSASPQDKNLSDILNQEPNKISENVSTSSLWSTIQSKISLNVIIFLVFLVGVIGWIFWVNRELAKERKERETAINDNLREENPYDQSNINKTL